VTAEIVLGTAQFGTAYGVTNAVGRLDDRTVADIVDTALRGGIRTFDTAFAYGDAEERLGRAAARSEAPIRAVTKISLADLGSSGVESYVRAAAERLGAARLDILLHRPSDVRDPAFPGVLDELRAAQASGAIGAFGASVYDEQELEAVVETMPDLAIVQVPGSIVDRRMLDLPFLSELARSGVEVHVRSLFLQGVLLARTADLAPRFSQVAPVLAAIDRRAEELGTSRIALLIAAVRADPLVDGLVVGATSASEITATLDAASLAAADPLELDGLPDEILDPRRWVD